MKVPFGFQVTYRCRAQESDLEYFRRCEKATVKGIMGLFGLTFIVGMNFRQMGTPGTVLSAVILFVLITWMLFFAWWNAYAALMTDRLIGFQDQEGYKSEQTGPANHRPSGTSGMAPADPLRGQEPCQKQAVIPDRGR